MATKTIIITVPSNVAAKGCGGEALTVKRVPVVPCPTATIYNVGNMSFLKPIKAVPPPIPLQSQPNEVKRDVLSHMEASDFVFKYDCSRKRQRLTHLSPDEKLNRR